MKATFLQHTDVREWIPGECHLGDRCGQKVQSSYCPNTRIETCGRGDEVTERKFEEISTLPLDKCIEKCFHKNADIFKMPECKISFAVGVMEELVGREKNG